MSKENQSKLVNLLQSWMDEGDTDEQQETGEYLIYDKGSAAQLSYSRLDIFLKCLIFAVIKTHSC